MEPATEGIEQNSGTPQDPRPGGRRSRTYNGLLSGGDNSHTHEYLVCNETPRRIEIKLGAVKETNHDEENNNTGSDDKVLMLAPLETRKVPEEICNESNLQYLRPWLERNILAVNERQTSLPSYIGKIGLGGLAAAFWYLIIAVPVVALFFSHWYPQVWLGLPVLFLPFLGAITKHYALQRIDPRMIGQLFSLALILAIGVGLPALSIYFFGEGQLLMAKLSSLTLLGRVLQLFFISIVALLPALLFFLFDRLQLGTLRSRFNRQIFRLDPTVKTLTEVRARYGEELREVYGPEDTGNSAARLLGGTRWPILVATLVITLGWIVTLLPVQGAVEIQQAIDLHKLFVPQQTAINFAFLGAYFFALNTILRRYLRGDLRPKAYSSITVRIIIVVILAWVLELIFSGKGQVYLLALVFLVGIFPETGLTLIREYLRVGPSLKEEHPLTNLEGIDLYDRARLMDEGVTNVESLAHHELIDLMLQTRVSVPRLVDWVDQAILYLHMPDGQTSSGNGGMGTGLRDTLHHCGIRTATDLEQSWGSVEKLFSSREDCETIRRLQVVKDALKDDEWMPYIRHWRCTSLADQESEETVKKPDEIYSLPEKSDSVL